MLLWLLSLPPTTLQYFIYIDFQKYSDFLFDQRFLFSFSASSILQPWPPTLLDNQFEKNVKANSTETRIISILLPLDNNYVLRKSFPSLDD
jgi:hypothetical protein